MLPIHAVEGQDDPAKYLRGLPASLGCHHGDDDADHGGISLQIINPQLAADPDLLFRDTLDELGPDCVQASLWVCPDGKDLHGWKAR